MPIGSRVRANNAYGATSDSPNLLTASTSFNSTQLQLLPAIVAPTQHAVIVLDPRRVFGEPEIVVVTAHAGFSTTATITRGAYGTTARDHPSGTAWVHIEIDEDFIEVLTSTTRPSDPYVGEVIFETDTMSRRHYDGSIWNSSPSIGSLIPFLGSVAPSGYLFADGSAVSRTGVTANLFATIGTTYGVGDGVTTFNLPNLQGRIPVGRNVADADFDNLGDTSAGEKQASLDQSKMPQHKHTVAGPSPGTVWGHRHGESAHHHSLVNLPFVGVLGDHVHGASISGAPNHDHLTTDFGQNVMVIAAAAGPFNVSPPGGDFVTYDVGGTARTSTSFHGSHPFTFNDSGNLFVSAKTNQLSQVTGITATAVNRLNGGTTGPNADVTTLHNNIQPYITINYLVKI